MERTQIVCRACRDKYALLVGVTMTVRRQIMPGTRTIRVGKAFCLYEMAGNVWQWAED